MELPQIGKQCGDSTCKQLDFLPLTCKCGKLFCSDHFNKHIENCPAIHNTKQVELKKIDGLYVCSHPECKSTSIVPIVCERCHKNFCVTHRHITECYEKPPEVIAAEKEKYAAPVRKFNEAKAAVDSQLEENIEKAKKKSKTSDTANKVQLMRIKNKAIGLKTIPVMDRVYFNVEHPSTMPSKTFPVFVSKEWTVGRTIDSIAQECKVLNNNNVSTALKLRLFKKTSGKIVSPSVSVKMGDLLSKNAIINGENLLLEYVSDSCLQVDINK